MRRHAWWVLSGVLGAALLAGALLSPDRQQRLQEHVAEGLMRALPAEQVQVADITAGARQWRLQRQAGSWVAHEAAAASGSTPGAAPAGMPPADLGARVEMALRLLRNSTAERSFAQPSPEFGLAPPALQVQLRGSTAADAPVLFEARFGAPNPIGLARYAQAGPPQALQVVLLPSYVAEAWEAAAGLR